MSYMLVGESPPRGLEHKPSSWLDPDLSKGNAATRMRDIAGWTSSLFKSVFSFRTNIAQRPVSKWKSLDVSESIIRADQLSRLSLSMELLGIVCLGRRAMYAFTLERDNPPFIWTRVAVGELSVLVAYFPHTSGKSRVWNHEYMRDAAQGFLSLLVQTPTFDAIPNGY